MRFLAVFILFLALPAWADEPWVAHGQTKIPSHTGIDNPQPNFLGALGEVAGLPYQVPQGKTLVLDCWGIESYDKSGSTFIFPFVGPDNGPIPTGGRKDISAMTVSAHSASNFLCGFNLHFPSGTWINVHLFNGQPGNHVIGWGVSGWLY